VDGKPVPLWDAKTGKINRGVAEQWKRYDLRLVVEQNWKTLAPKLKANYTFGLARRTSIF
jgi:hypothetical protein